MKNLYRFEEFLLEADNIGDFVKGLDSKLNSVKKEIEAEVSKPERTTIPFKNNTEGNEFRAWVNKEYPDYAKKIDLDPSSSKDNGYNNKYIEKAWREKGKEWKK